MRSTISSEVSRGVVRAGGVLLVLALCSQPGAQAQVSGSIQVGQSRSTTVYNNGQIDTRIQGGSLNVGFGQPTARVGNGGGPYGRLNFGRSPSFHDDGRGAPVGGIAPGSFQDPLWTGLIDRNFQIMRRNSPFPNQFSGGIYNPTPFHHRFVPHRFGVGFPVFGNFLYSDYAFGYPSAIYGGYVPSVYSLYGSWYPPYLPTDRVYIIERDVIHDRPDAGSVSPDREEEEGESSKPTASEDGEYYLAPRSGETLEDAIADIRHAWVNGDFARLKSRLADKGRVRIYLKGKYKYSVDAPDFEQMTQDAMRRIDTSSFTLDHVKRLADDRAFVSGKHVYYDPDHEKHEVYVSYGLTKLDGRWKITEAGSSTEPIVSHSG